MDFFPGGEDEESYEVEHDSVQDDINRVAAMGAGGDEGHVRPGDAQPGTPAARQQRDRIPNVQSSTTDTRPQAQAVTTRGRHQIVAIARSGVAVQRRDTALTSPPGVPQGVPAEHSIRDDTEHSASDADIENGNVDEDSDDESLVDGESDNDASQQQGRLRGRIAPQTADNSTSTSNLDLMPLGSRRFERDDRLATRFLQRPLPTTMTPPPTEASPGTAPLAAVRRNSIRPVTASSRQSSHDLETPLLREDASDAPSDIDYSSDSSESTPANISFAGRNTPDARSGLTQARPAPATAAMANATAQGVGVANIDPVVPVDSLVPTDGNAGAPTLVPYTHNMELQANTRRETSHLPAQESQILSIELLQRPDFAGRKGYFIHNASIDVLSIGQYSDDELIAKGWSLVPPAVRTASSAPYEVLPSPPLYACLDPSRESVGNFVRDSAALAAGRYAVQPTASLLRKLLVRQALWQSIHRAAAGPPTRPEALLPHVIDSLAEINKQQQLGWPQLRPPGSDWRGSKVIELLGGIVGSIVPGVVDVNSAGHGPSHWQPLAAFDWVVALQLRPDRVPIHVLNNLQYPLDVHGCALPTDRLSLSTISLC